MFELCGGWVAVNLRLRNHLALIHSFVKLICGFVVQMKNAFEASLFHEVWVFRLQFDQAFIIQEDHP